MTGPAAMRRRGADLRFTVDLHTFARWRAATAGWALPEDFEIETPGPPPDPVPPASAPAGWAVPPAEVAASLAVHASAEAAIRLRVDDGQYRAVVCLSVAGDLAAVLARAASSAPGPGWAAGGWVQVGVLPLTGAVPEVMAWVPEPGRTGAPPLGSMQLLLVGADDAGAGELASWLVEDGEWRRLVPGPDGGVTLRPQDRAAVAAELTAALVRVLGERDHAGSDGGR
jgi:hypothetical protein